MSENMDTEKHRDSQAAPPRESARGGMSRRALCCGIGASAVLLGLGAIKLFPVEAQLRPPGAQDEQRVLATCIRCERCVEACPHEVLTMQHIEDGLLGMRTPVMKFTDDYCTACAELEDEIPRCMAVCPTNVFDIPTGAKPEEVVIGVAVVDEEQCLTFRGVRCQFCYEACPFEAIEMVSHKPRVIVELCTGCGACESVCISHKAGSIVGNSKRRAVAVVPVYG